MSDNQGITPPHLQGFGSPSTGGASMSEEELKKRVDEIISLSGDPETAHWEEDKLMAELLTQHLPEGLLKEVVRLQKADFSRWYA